MEDLRDETGGSSGLEDRKDRGCGQFGGELVGDGPKGEEHGRVGGKGGDAGFRCAATIRVSIHQ